MEKALRFLDPSRRNEEKVVGILLLNKLLQQVHTQYEDEREKVPIATDFILEKVYDKINSQFIVELILSKTFPDIQKEAVDFISFHIFSSKYLTLYEEDVPAFIGLLIETHDVDIQKKLSVLIRHLSIISEHLRVAETTISKILSSPFISTSQSQDQLLSLLVNLLQSLVLKSADITKHTPLCVNELQAFGCASLILPGLFGAASERRRDLTLAQVRDLLQLPPEILSSSWIFTSTASPGVPQPRKKASFANFLLRIVADELHLIEEETICCFREMTITATSVTENGKIKLLRRLERCCSVFLVCLDILDNVVSAFLCADEISIEEISTLKELLSKIVDDLLSFLGDSGSCLAGLAESDDSYDLLRAMTSRGVLLLKFLRSEDPSLDDQIASEFGRLFQLSASFTMNSVPGKVFFSVCVRGVGSDTDGGNKEVEEEKTEFVDGGVLLLLLCSEMILDFLENNSSDEVGPELRTESILLEKMMEQSPVILTLTTLLAKFLLFDREILSENELQLLKDAVNGGLTIVHWFLKEKSSDVKILIEMEGVEKAIPSILGCGSSQMEALYEVLSKEKQKFEDFSEAARQVADILEALLGR